MTITCCELYHDALRQPRIAIRYSDGTEEDRAPTPSELHLLKRTPTEARRSGWQLVPVEPTPAMIDAAGHACDGLNLSDLDKIGKSQAKAWYRWRDMLAAAPSAVSPQREKS